MAPISRALGSAGYWWMSSRSRNASRRFAVMGIAGGLVFIVALIAFVLVPRQATRAAVRVSSTLEERPDSNRTVAIRNRAVAEMAKVDSILDASRRPVAAPVTVNVVDTFPPEAIAQRQALADEVATLNRLIERADNAPLPSSYRALATAPSLANDPVVRSLLDSLADALLAVVEAALPAGVLVTSAVVPALCAAAAFAWAF